MHTTILRNTTVGDNVIIGANSLVKGEIESNSVYAGCPAKRICSIEKYETKIKNRQYDEAVQIAKAYKTRFGENPPEAIYQKYDYFMLWSSVENHIARVKDAYPTRKCEKVLIENKEHKPMFANYDEFLKSITDL